METGRLIRTKAITRASRAIVEDTRIIVNALRTLQGREVVYSFFLRGNDVARVADIERVGRDRHDKLKGFQRPEIQKHVQSILEYLNNGTALFPNAIILAISPEVEFTQSRGPKRKGALDLAEAGYLQIPLREPGQRVAWVVDGQQRSIALSKTSNTELPVPVIAFVSDDLEVQRQQFIVVNKARPLPQRLIDELLPETAGVLLPRDLASRRVPSELCNTLNKDKTSPFFGLIRRPSLQDGNVGVVIDSAVVGMIKDRIESPLGALGQLKGFGSKPAELGRMYELLVAYWSAVKKVFPHAWGKPVQQSRLMHSAGISAMGMLMDRIAAKIDLSNDAHGRFEAELRHIAPNCAWTHGIWPYINVPWNGVEHTKRSVKALAEVLSRLYVEAGRR